MKEVMAQQNKSHGLTTIGIVAPHGSERDDGDKPGPTGTL
jgi:hypothetical protein